MTYSVRLRRYLTALILALVGLWGIWIGGPERMVGVLALIVALVCAAALYRSDRRRAGAEREEQKQLEQAEGQSHPPVQER